jgi:hypothetical protein
MFKIEKVDGFQRGSLICTAIPSAWSRLNFGKLLIDAGTDDILHGRRSVTPSTALG